jgi:hypothetical protein
MPDSAASDTPYPSHTSEPDRPWFGWIAFAGAMLILLGTFHAIAGLVALFDEDYYLVGKGGLVVEVDYTGWGWIHLIIGVILILAGMGLFTGQTWARIVAVTVAMISAVVNLAFLAAYPLWSAIMIAVDILVIYAVLVYGDKRTLRSP